jgi:hypothetical protein
VPCRTFVTSGDDAAQTDTTAGQYFEITFVRFGLFGVPHTITFEGPCSSPGGSQAVLGANRRKVIYRLPLLGDRAILLPVGSEGVLKTKLTLDLHDIYNSGTAIEKALKGVFDDAVAKKAPLVEIIPGKGSGQLKKYVLRFLQNNPPAAANLKSYRIEKDSKNFGRIFVHFHWK